MKINQLVVGRRYYFVNSPKQFIEVLYRNEAQNIIVYEQFQLQNNTVKIGVQRAITSVIPSNGSLHVYEFSLAVPKVTKVLLHYFGGFGYAVDIFNSNEEVDQWIAERPTLVLLKRETVQYDDPTYVEPKAEDEDEVNEV